MRLLMLRVDYRIQKDERNVIINNNFLRLTLIGPRMQLTDVRFVATIAQINVGTNHSCGDVISFCY